MAKPYPYPSIQKLTLMVKIESLVVATDVVSHIGTLATPSSSHVVELAQRMVYICYNITIVFIW